MAEVDEEPCLAVLAEAEAAGIICSLRAGDLAGWTPPWTTTGGPPSEALVAEPAKEEEGEAGGGWPAVTRGKRSRRRSPSGGSAADGKTGKKKKRRRRARGSPASPLDCGAASASASASASGASTSGAEDGAFCSPEPPPAAAVAQAVPSAAQASSAKVCSARVRRPPPRPTAAGPRSRKKMRLPEVQQLVRSLAAENDGLREEVESLQRACSALSRENGTLETRLEHSSSKRKRTVSEEQDRRRQRKPTPQLAAEHRGAPNGFVLPDLNIPAAAPDDVGSAP